MNSLCCAINSVENKTNLSSFAHENFRPFAADPPKLCSGSRPSTDRFQRKFKKKCAFVDPRAAQTLKIKKKWRTKHTFSEKRGYCIVSFLHPFLLFQRQRGASSTRSAGCELIEARSGNELGSCCEADAHRCWQASTTALDNHCGSTQQGDSKCTNDHRHPNLCRKYQTR
jgi:hypothetical protein